jgi:SNF2 family DNA or RNA helicase
MELSERGRSARENAKAERLLQILEDLPDKLVVFTQFRATQEMLLERLRAEGHKVALFHGGLSRLEKERQIERFRHEERVLLATDSGSEGRNLQFCNAICNFDLPWNPMRIEQRIGRLSRIGQTRDVHVFNLVAADTIEAAILHLLDAKLAMFELVIGEIDMVLGNLDTEQEFSDLVTDLWAESANMNDFTRRMDQLGDRLVAAKAAYFRQRAIENQIFRDKFQPEQ